MPRYLIERLFDQRKEDLLGKAGTRSAELRRTEFSDLRWLHSHLVASDENGFVRTFCLYEGPTAERVREHGLATGNHEILNVYEVADDAVPEGSPYVVG
jgi:Protein of unknown function (DUF4242)